MAEIDTLDSSQDVIIPKFQILNLAPYRQVPFEELSLPSRESNISVGTLYIPDDGGDYTNNLNIFFDRGGGFNGNFNIHKVILANVAPIDPGYHRGSDTLLLDVATRKNATKINGDGQVEIINNGQLLNFSRQSTHELTHIRVYDVLDSKPEYTRSFAWRDENIDSLNFFLNAFLYNRNINIWIILQEYLWMRY